MTANFWTVVYIYNLMCQCFSYCRYRFYSHSFGCSYENALSVLPGFPPGQTAGWSMFPFQTRRTSQRPLTSTSKKVNLHWNEAERELNCQKIVISVQLNLLSPRWPRWHVALLKHCCVICVGGPLLYDDVQLVQNSAALNGTQRVLLDHVISEEECSELRRLAHVGALHNSDNVMIFISWL